MAEGLRSLFGKIKGFLRGTTTRGQTIPPYLLIGLLWWLSAVSSDREQREEEREADINIAELQYITDLQLAQAAADIRKDCLDDARGRNNTVENWYNLFDFLRSQGPEFQDFANDLEFDFKNRPRNRPLDVDEYCRDYPVPQPVHIPPILIEEGIVSP